jgi:hypothetical protein
MSFFPDDNQLGKKIILKVSDFRSAMIQGKFSAKKGFTGARMNQGLNCGVALLQKCRYLLGPILEESLRRKTALVQSRP